MSVSRRRSSGFTMIEVLVAVVVLATGILGVGAMQMVSFQTNQGAYSRSLAIYLAQDIFDRMRANPDGYRTTDVYDDFASGGDLPTNPNCATTLNGCSSEALAEHDVREWAAHFRNVNNNDNFRPKLPNGAGTISRIGTSNEFEVVVSWDEREWDADNPESREITTHSVTLRALMN